MEAFIGWISDNWRGGLEALIALGVFLGWVVSRFNGPRARKASTWIERILLLARRYGINARFKDEPGGPSLPGQKDSGERVATVVRIPDDPGGTPSEPAPPSP